MLIHWNGNSSSFDEIFIIGCTEKCQFDNFRYSQRFHQNDTIFVSLLELLFWYPLIEVKLLPLSRGSGIDFIYGYPVLQWLDWKIGCGFYSPSNDRLGDMPYRRAKAVPCRSMWCQIRTIISVPVVLYVIICCAWPLLYRICVTYQVCSPYVIFVVQHHRVQYSHEVFCSFVCM